MLSREEKIRFLKDRINFRKLRLEAVENDSDSYKKYEYDITIYERELKLLQLPQRTIETLEVGDIVLTKHDVLNEIFATTIRNETLRHTYISHKDWFNVVQIIPHEALELLKEVIG